MCGVALDILNNFDSSVKYNITSNPVLPDAAIFVEDNMEILSGIYGMTISNSKYNALKDIENGTLLDNQLVKAAIEYCGIENPEITKTVIYNNNGDVYEFSYIITESGKNDFNDILNKNFNYVEVYHVAGGAEDAHIAIPRIGVPEIHRSEKIISLDRAIKYVAEKYLDLNTQNVITEVEYNADIQPGYFIPCYKLYVEESKLTGNLKNDLIKYRVIYIPMVGKVE